MSYTPVYADLDNLKDRVTGSSRKDPETILASLTGKSVLAERDTYLVDDVIYRAESVVNSYLVKLYATPLDANPLCEEWTLAICEYFLYRRATGPKVPEKYKMAYDDTIKELEKASVGKTIIPIPGDGGTVEPPTPTETVGQFRIESDVAQFSEDNFTGF